MAMSVTYATVNGQLVYEDRGGTETYYLNDPLGSVVQCHNASGAKTYEAWYWPYGEMRVATGSNPSPWGFVGSLGYYTDDDSHTYVRARIYRPDLARWQTVDPLWPTVEAYCYCGSAPTVAVDPSGRLSVFGACIVAGGFVAIIELLRNYIVHSGSLPNGTCKSAAGCLGAILGSVLGSLFGGGIAAGCLAGLISSVVADIGSRLCDHFFPAAPCYQNPTPIICDVVSALAGTAVGCFGGHLSGQQVFDGIIGALGVEGGQLGLDVCMFHPFK